MERYLRNCWYRAGWAEKPVSLGIDQGGTRARRIPEAMIAKEAAHG